MQIFRHAEDRLPIALFALFFASDLVVYALVDSVPWLLAWFLVGFIPKGAICAWNHHHQHLAVFRAAPFNRLLELMYGLQTGITSHAWVLHHSLGHHVNYLDQRTDESRWRRDDGTPMGELEYSLKVGGAAYGRAWQVGRRNPRYAGIFVAMMALTLSIAAGLVAWRPIPALIVFIAPMAVMLFFTAWATFTHHSGKKTSSHFVASNNILHRGYNILTGNLGYHTAHHYKPGVHWSRLPALHDAIAHRVPADCYVSPGLPWNFGQRVVGPPAGMPFAAGTSVADDCEPSLPMSKSLREMLAPAVSLLVALTLVTAGCASAAPPPEPAPVITVPADEASVAEPPAAPAPERGAAAEAKADTPSPCPDGCAAGEQCWGPQGCDAAWSCGPARPCTRDLAAFCGCDGKTFHSSSTCPNGRYAHPGACPGDKPILP